MNKNFNYEKSILNTLFAALQEEDNLVFLSFSISKIEGPNPSNQIIKAINKYNATSLNLTF